MKVQKLKKLKMNLLNMKRNNNKKKQNNLKMKLKMFPQLIYRRTMLKNSQPNKKLIAYNKVNMINNWKQCWSERIKLS